MATDAARLGKARTGEHSEEPRAGEKQEQPVIGRAWSEPAGLLGLLSTAQSARNGLRLMLLAFLFFVLGGLNAAVIRFQLAQPNNTLVTPEQYNQLFTMHGSTMLFLFAVPFMLGGALLLLPLVIGARGVPWPRLTTFVFWIITLGGLLLEASWLFGPAPDGGWTGFAPLSGSAFSPGRGLDFWLLALMMIAVGGILACAVLITTAFKSRAPGMSIGRMPLLAWAVLTMSGTLFFAFIFLLSAAALLESDRKFGTRFFDPAGGGSPLLWQYLFWLFGLPAVYIPLIPAAGIASTVLPAVLRQRTIGYRFLVASFMITALSSFVLWGDPAYGAQLSPAGMAGSTVAGVLFALAAAVQASAWLATIWHGAGKWNTPYLFILGYLFLFLLGIITGVMLALEPFDAQVRGSLFVVANLHYLLIGTIVFPIFAGFYYWFPKFTGRFLDERLGKWNFWLMFVGFNIAFLPMFISGLLGTPRRLYTYPSSPELDLLNLVSTAGAVVLVLGIAAFIVNLIASLANGKTAAANPWNADSLEWATNSPVPAYGFRQIPIVQTRHPLWDQERLDAGNDKTVGLVGRLAEWPAWRAALVTSTLSSEPEAVYRVAGPSPWPLVAAIGTALVFVSFLFDQLAMLGIFSLGLIMLLVGLIGWHRQGAEQDAVPAAELDEFRNSYGVPIDARGSPRIDSWALGLTVLGLAVALAVGVYCWLVLRANSPAWPPVGIVAPGRSVPLIATAFLLAAELLVLFGSRLARGDRSSLGRMALLAAFILGAGFLVLQVASYLFAPLSASASAYGSIFIALSLLITLIAAIGLGILLRSLWAAWRAGDERRTALAATGAAVYWTFVVVAWLVVLAMLYLIV
ncbi:MAG: cbb3-type cytochrome c oxidase subunit I [Rudaea sp.]